MVTDVATSAEAELTREVKELRQLLQAGIMLALAVLEGDFDRADLQEWVDEVSGVVTP